MTQVEVPFKFKQHSSPLFSTTARNGLFYNRSHQPHHPHRSKFADKGASTHARQTTAQQRLRRLNQPKPKPTSQEDAVVTVEIVGRVSPDSQDLMPPSSPTPISSTPPQPSSAAKKNNTAIAATHSAQSRSPRLSCKEMDSRSDSEAPKFAVGRKWRKTFDYNPSSSSPVRRVKPPSSLSLAKQHQSKHHQLKQQQPQTQSQILKHIIRLRRAQDMQRQLRLYHFTHMQAVSSSLQRNGASLKPSSATQSTQQHPPKRPPFPQKQVMVGLDSAHSDKDSHCKDEETLEDDMGTPPESPQPLQGLVCCPSQARTLHRLKLTLVGLVQGTNVQINASWESTTNACSLVLNGRKSELSAVLSRMHRSVDDLGQLRLIKTGDTPNDAAHHSCSAS